jgi:N,N-dimethylformamidase
MLALAGYADRLSARPGETLHFHVSGPKGAALEARVVRVVSADPNPAGPGIVLVPTALAPRRIAEVVPQPVTRGSYGRVAMGGQLARLADWTVIATVMATRFGARHQALISWRGAASQRGALLLIGEDGRLGVAAGSGQGWCGALTLDRWHDVWATYEAGARRLRFGWRAHGAAADDASEAVVEDVDATAAADDDLYLAGADPGLALATFNGRMERPLIHARALSAEERAAAFRGAAVAGLLAHWDLGREIASRRIIDIGPHGLEGRLVNMPTRAVTGAAWSGREMCWRHAPAEYAAVHFHDDDIDDCRWPATYELALPADLRSGSYALLLRAGGNEENIPFFVAPPKGRATARIAVLMSTFTYVVYHNNARFEWLTDPAWREVWHARAAAWQAYPHNPGDHPEYGWSTYNYHSDGTGICFASWQRPMLTVRVGFVTYPHEEIRGSGLRHYPADHHLLWWLERQGYDFDLITDWELHHEGHALLARYPVVLTGTHPEYHTREMLDALTAYRDGGGRFCYLGGNGFYWKIALAQDQPGLIEIRRAEGGIRAWAAEVGEYYNQLDGEYGGLWRRNGRPPQELCGVGFTAQGNFVGSYYRIRPEARRDARVAWMLAGIEDERIGDFGLSGHGAAGFELDRTDKRLGTPAHAVVVASSENHPPEAPWVLVPEEQLTHLMTWPGKPAKELIRADLTFFETAGGKGAVFSTGSITFCGSLPANGGDNNVSRLMRNVLDRFLDPAPFPPPRE